MLRLNHVPTVRPTRGKGPRTKRKALLMAGVEVENAAKKQRRPHTEQRESAALMYGPTLPKPLFDAENERIKKANEPKQERDDRLVIV